MDMVSTLQFDSFARRSNEDPERAMMVPAHMAVTGHRGGLAAGNPIANRTTEASAVSGGRNLVSLAVSSAHVVSQTRALPKQISLP